MKSPSTLLSKKRPRDAHKGTFGYTLVVGGNVGMGGSVRLAGEAAARVGSGLTAVAAHVVHGGHICAAVPELMSYPIESADQLQPLMEKATVIVVGPGLGQDPWAGALFDSVLNSQLPLVVDADALNLLAAAPAKRGNWVLTPHPGEAGRLLDAAVADVQANRTGAVSELASRYDAVVILKGAGSLAAAMNKPVRKYDLGNPGMASGGMGDALAGVIGGFVAQGMDLYEAACSGVYVHAIAGDKAAEEQGERGMLAGDLIKELRGVVNGFSQ